MTLVNRKPKIQKFELSVIAIKQVAARRTILPSPSHILTQAVEGAAFWVIPFWILSITLSDVVFERLNPINFVGLLQRTREHGRLNHVYGCQERGAPIQDRRQENGSTGPLIVIE